MPPWFTLFILLSGFCAVFSCLYPTISISQLKLVCKDLGYHPDCNNDEAIRKSAMWSTYVSVVTGVLTCISIGFWTATSDRMGRRWTLLIPALGSLCLLLSWAFLYWFRHLRHLWHRITLSATVVGTITGSTAVALISFYGQCGDLTALDPQSRGWLFVLLDGSMGISSILGTRMAGLADVVGVNWVFTFTAGLYMILVLFALLFYRETIDPVVQAKPIDWKKAHLFGALTYCCFSRSTRRALDADAMVLYRKRVDLYYGVSLDPDMELPMDSAELEGSAALMAAQTVPAAPETALSVADGADSISYAAEEVVVDAGVEQVAPHKASSRAAPRASPRADTGAATPLLNASDDSSNISTIDTDDSTIKASASRLLPPAPSSAYMEACPPRYVPVRNALPVLATCLALNCVAVSGYTSVTYGYLKHQFDVGANDYANMLTCTAVSRAIGSLVVVPLVKPLLRMPQHELRAMQVAFAIQGICMCCYYFATSFWHTIVLDGLNSVVSCVSYGYMRALMTNQTSTLLQGRILGLITVVQVLTVVVGGTGVSWLFAVTTDVFPSACYQLFGAAFFASAVAPVFIRDSEYDFNHRNIGRFHDASQDVNAGGAGGSDDTLIMSGDEDITRTSTSTSTGTGITYGPDASACGLEAAVSKSLSGSASGALSGSLSSSLSALSGSALSTSASATASASCFLDNSHAHDGLGHEDIELLFGGSSPPSRAHPGSIN